MGGDLLYDFSNISLKSHYNENQHNLYRIGKNRFLEINLKPEFCSTMAWKFISDKDSVLFNVKMDHLSNVKVTQTCLTFTTP